MNSLSKGAVTSRDFFQKRKLDQQRSAVDYLATIRDLIKNSDRHLVQLYGSAIKDVNEAPQVLSPE